MKKDNTEELFQELIAIANIEERKKVVYRDISKKRPRYKEIAQSDSYLFFKLLGGDETAVEATDNWAFEYTYDDYIEATGEEPNKADKKNWNLEQESIKQADDTAHWYVTGLYLIEGEDGVKLPFEFAFCEGYLDEIIGTPYNTPESGKQHGIPFD